MDRETGFMLEAIQLGRQGMLNDAGGPFGCIIVKGEEIIGRGWNRVTSDNDPTAHAEVTAIRDACHRLQAFQLEGCEVYTSCEPCPMCLGAIYWARPAKVYFAARHTDAAAAGFDDSMIYKELAVPVAERKISMTCIIPEKGARLFDEWINKENKKAY
ncbi:MAG: nucleoside deaminase [Chitinophagaceae bacterium]